MLMSVAVVMVMYSVVNARRGKYPHRRRFGGRQPEHVTQYLRNTYDFISYNCHPFPTKYAPIVWLPLNIFHKSTPVSSLLALKCLHDLCASELTFNRLIVVLLFDR